MQTRDLAKNVGDFLSDEMHHRQEPELPRIVDDATAFIQTSVIPAFNEVRGTLKRDGREVRILNGQNNARLRVLSEGLDEFSYVVTTRLTPQGAVPYFETTGRLGGKSGASEDSLRAGALPLAHREYDGIRVTTDEIARHALAAYRAHMEG